MTDGPQEFESASWGLPPLLPDHAPAPRHRVKAHDRTLPPRPVVDRSLGTIPLALDLPPLPPPGPRKVPVVAHHRRNPRRRDQEITMTTPTFGHELLQQEAHARRTDPETSHAAARTVDLTKRQVQTLEAFRRQVDQEYGMTDEELVDSVHGTEINDEVVRRPSPSGLRTARKALQEVGLLLPLIDGTTVVTRPTRLGNEARVFILSQAGREFPLEAP